MKNRVVFDIGHGSDTWPPSKGICLPDGKSFAEHSFNSAAAVAAKELAEKNGFEILLPQQPYSPDVPSSARSYWINREHRKSPILCLLSFHANAATDTASGHCVFHWSNSRNGKHLAELWDKYANGSCRSPGSDRGSGKAGEAAGAIFIF